MIIFINNYIYEKLLQLCSYYNSFIHNFRFRDIYGKLTFSIADLDFPTLDERLTQKKFEIVTLCKDFQKQEYIRGDYKELVNLVFLYLSDENEHCIKHFNLPGALYRARWMYKMIYCIKLDLLGTKMVKELPRGGVLALINVKK